MVFQVLGLRLNIALFPASVKIMFGRLFNCLKVNLHLDSMFSWVCDGSDYGIFWKAQ